MCCKCLVQFLDPCVRPLDARMQSLSNFLGDVQRHGTMESTEVHGRSLVGHAQNEAINLLITGMSRHVVEPDSDSRAPTIAALHVSLSVRTEVCEPNADAASKTVCMTIISVSVRAAR
jgi:hypothetical protein